MHIKPEAFNSVLRDVEMLKSTIDPRTPWIDVYTELCVISEKIEMLKDLAGIGNHS